MKSEGLFVSGLQIAFIVLRILNKIKWSWWWVLSPMWIVTSFSLLVIAGYFVYILIKER